MSKSYSVFDFCADLDIVRTTYTWALVGYCRRHGVEIERVYNKAKTQHRLYISRQSLDKFAELWAKERLTAYDKSTATYKARDLLMKKIRELK